MQICSTQMKNSLPTIKFMWYGWHGINIARAGNVQIYKSWQKWKVKEIHHPHWPISHWLLYEFKSVSGWNIENVQIYHHTGNLSTADMGKRNSRPWLNVTDLGSAIGPYLNISRMDHQENCFWWSGWNTLIKLDLKTKSKTSCNTDSHQINRTEHTQLHVCEDERNDEMMAIKGYCFWQWHRWNSSGYPVSSINNSHTYPKISKSNFFKNNRRNNGRQKKDPWQHKWLRHKIKEEE